MPGLGQLGAEGPLSQKVSQTPEPDPLPGSGGCQAPVCKEEPWALEEALPSRVSLGPLSPWLAVLHLGLRSMGIWPAAALPHGMWMTPDRLPTLSEGGGVFLEWGRGRHRALMLLTAQVWLVSA